MEIIKVSADMAEALAPLAAGFRAELSALRGAETSPVIEACREELLDFLKAGFPVFAAAEGERLIGYVVCRIDEPCLWVEQLYVLAEHRRRGAASLLFKKAEELAAAMGEETVFNYVHPNNQKVIGFLRSKGYTVLNMIELRKPYRGETPNTKINVGNNVFDY